MCCTLLQYVVQNYRSKYLSLFLLLCLQYCVTCDNGDDDDDHDDDDDDDDHKVWEKCHLFKE